MILEHIQLDFQSNIILFTHTHTHTHANIDINLSFVSHLQDLGVIIFENPSRRLLVVTYAGHEEVKRFWRNHKKERD